MPMILPGSEVRERPVDDPRFRYLVNPVNVQNHSRRPKIGDRILLLLRSLICAQPASFRASFFAFNSTGNTFQIATFWPSVAIPRDGNAGLLESTTHGIFAGISAKEATALERLRR